ncbi:MAG: hypothetical protein H6600_02730 [Flavobacteriales bacterium]|nr:hypothetical protein [Flavobacteriales bacterium]
MKKFVYSIVISLIILGCKKDDEINPSIMVDSPSAMTSYSYEDIITVKGNATDDESLKSIKIELLDENQNATDFSFEITVNTNNYNFDKSFQLDDRHLTSGKKYLKVSAIDKAGNRDSKFIEIYYTELPIEFRGMLIINKISNNVYDFYSHDLNSLQFIQSFTGNFQDIISDGYNQLAWLSGGTTGNLITYDLENELINWQKTPSAAVFPYFGRLYQFRSDKNIAMGRGDGSVVSMDEDGIINRTYTLNTGVNAEEMIEIGNYLLIEERVNNTSYLVTYVKSTGTRVQQILLNEDIIKLQPKDNSEIFIATSGLSTSHLYTYDINSNSTYEPHSLPSGSLSDVTALSDNEIILAHQTGILRFTLDNNSMVNISSDVATQIEYESLSNTLFVKVNNTLNLYDNLGNSQGSINPGVNISKFVLFYNK